MTDFSKLLKDATLGPWRIYVQDIADKAQAKKELCDLVEGTPNFQPRLVYVTDDDWNLAICITGCGEKSEANARAIVSIPDMQAEIDRLRALNAEMREALKELHALIDFDEPITNDKPMSFKDASTINEAMKRARAILAKTEA